MFLYQESFIFIFIFIFILSVIKRTCYNPLQIFSGDDASNTRFFS